MNAALVATVLAFSALASPDSVVERGRLAVVQLVGEGAGDQVSAGTGFFVTEEGWIATNHHVVDGATRMAAVPESGEPIEVGLLASDAEHDLAILGPLEPSGPWPWLELGAPPAMGREILVLGFPMAGPKTLTDGLVAAEAGHDQNEPALIRFTAKIAPGSSGSPLLDLESGRVVAVAVAHTLDDHQTYLAISVDRLAALLAGIDPDAEAEPLAGHLSGWTNLLISLLFFGVIGGWWWWTRPRKRHLRPIGTH